MNARELIENKVKTNLKKKIPKEAELDEEKADKVISKVLNSYIKYQNRKINNFHKEHVDIPNMIDYAGKVVLFD